MTLVDQVHHHASDTTDLPKKEMHPWVRKITVSYLPGRLDARLKWTLPPLLEWFRANGHKVQLDSPTDDTDLILTTGIAGHPVERGEALLFQAKRVFNLSRRPQVLALVSVSISEYEYRLKQFEDLAQRPLDGAATAAQFPGLGPEAAEVLQSQARRGPLVALGRYLLAQMKCTRVIALVGDESAVPHKAIHIDLAAAHAETPASEAELFAEDLGRRIVTTMSTYEVKDHTILDDPVAAEFWDGLKTPTAMLRAGPLFAEYGFFTDPISVEKLLGFRGLSDVIAAQFSEGCYAAFDPDLGGLITTATGSARLVDKRAISPEDLAYVVDVKKDGGGALVGKVKGRPVVVPSVEAVELRGICGAVATQIVENSRGDLVEVPTVRSILHGHLGVEAYDPERVERITLDAPFYHYPVSCGTQALARGTAEAFARSETLHNPDDPRQVVFLEQPCHGVLVAEKWMSGAEAFETIYNALESEYINMTPEVPQGPIQWWEDGLFVTKVT